MAEYVATRTTTRADNARVEQAGLASRWARAPRNAEEADADQVGHCVNRGQAAQFATALELVPTVLELVPIVLLGICFNTAGASSNAVATCSNRVVGAACLPLHC